MQVQASLQGSGATPLLEGRRQTPLPACLGLFLTLQVFKRPWQGPLLQAQGRGSLAVDMQCYAVFNLLLHDTGLGAERPGTQRPQG